MTRARAKRWRDLKGMARQANHVLAAAVVVFTAAILLGRLLEGWFIPLQAWLVGKMGPSVAATVFGPIIVDLPKVVFLLAAAFPVGRITAPRPWPTALGLAGLVYFFDFAFHYVLGTHLLLYGHWRAILGRGILLAIALWAVLKLVERGRRAAVTADRKGAAIDKKPKKNKKKKDHKEAKKAPQKQAEPGSETESDPTCKQQGSETVREGER